MITIVVLGLFVVVAAILGLSASTGSRASAAETASVSWLAWRVVGALAIVVFVMLFAFALRILRNAADWGLMAPGRRGRTYLLAAVLVVGAVGVVIALAGGEPDIPVRLLALRARTVLVTGMVAMVPWLALVWLAHAECGDLADALRVSRLPALLSARLLLLWKLLVACVSAFAVAVVAAIVNSGALRASFLAAHPHRGSAFPASNVLLYGAFFALILSLITIPLVAAWRSCAFEVVERAYPLPPDGLPTDEWLSSRSRLEKLLHLDVPLLRNPLTALSVFLPLVTATLAAFVPQLGAS